MRDNFSLKEPIRGARLPGRRNISASTAIWLNSVSYYHFQVGSIELGHEN